MVTVDSQAPQWAQLLVSQINQALLAIRPDNAVKITGGSINGTTIGLTTSAAGSFATTQVGGLTSTQTITAPGGATLIATTGALTNNAAAQVATIVNAPTAGNPTKWFAINDAGVTRYVPAW